jgi:hypothetical protein
MQKHSFSCALSMIFDRLSRHLGFSNLARLFSRVSNLGLLYLWFMTPSSIAKDVDFLNFRRRNTRKLQVLGSANKRIWTLYDLSVLIIYLGSK